MGNVSTRGSPSIRPPSWRKRAKKYLMARPLYMTLDKPDRVLDIGCGFGIYFTINHGAVGIDLNQDAIEECKRSGHNAMLADVAKGLHFGDKSFDWVIAYDFIEHLEQEDIRKTFREVSRVLDNGGRWLVAVPNRKGFDWDREITGHKTFVEKDLMKRLSNEAGFRIIRNYSYPFPKMLGEWFKHNKDIYVLMKS